ncbi:MAG TPA: haloacid dehalogenase type II [Thermomicrobiales bacterium]|nr:haloacid dehalogenase type II [Thermomicrobiales bacterium]
MRRLLVFDVNETLLDLGALDGLFAAAFGDAAARREWFAQTLQSALVLTVTGQYRDFTEIGAAALAMVAARRGVPLDPTLPWALRDRMLQLPPHPDAAPALDRLRDAGFRLAALTNNPQPVVDAQLTNADLRDRFERVLSVDGPRRLKPAPEVYRYAASELRVPIAGLRLIAAHSWDVTGAMRAGAAAAFIARPGQILDPLGETPDIIAPDLVAAADALVSGGRE